ncbi:hypothetical protein [Dyadobacter sp. LHD-138]|uniref:hypothetical protein n=1 Tax=Dyadobacter sp. LHD-138 TaxID=3071413 RepID=UPI0027E1C32F|nr:hypothetical protein [Dyadobacter sp. LHD-138]MDQ6482141.1 hypothetical protein [Dyadobacter sp. LHD-138]
MYRSKQFHIFNALPDEWYTEGGSRTELATKYPSGEFLAPLTSAYYYVTQVILFPARLTANGLYKQTRCESYNDLP